MKFLILASLFVLSVFAEPEAEADAQYRWNNWNRGYGYYPMSYGYNRWNNGYSGYGYNRYNNYNSYNRYNMYNRNVWGQRRFVREAEAEAEAQYPHHTSGYVKYSSGAIVPEDTDSVKLAKAQHREAHEEQRENEFNQVQTEENVFGEEGKPVTYDSNTPARPLRHYVQIFKQTQKTPELTYAINPFYHVYQPRVYGYAPVVYQKSPKTWGYYANSAGVVHAVAKREAEAEPEAEADAQYYNWNQGYNGYYPMTYGYNRWNNGYYGYGYNRYNNYRNFWGQRRYVREAEAEAEPEAEADAQYYNWNQGYNGYSRMNYGYNRWNNGYSGYGYNRYNNYNSYNRNFNYNSYNRYNSFNGYYRY